MVPILLVLSTSFVQANEPITVELKSGRTFTGWPDRRSDAVTLWLRFEGRHSYLLRPLAWDRIEALRQAGKLLTPRAVLDLRSDAAVPPKLGEKSSTGNETDRATATTHRDFAAKALGLLPPVRHVEFLAELANWDADPAPDGLRLYLMVRGDHNSQLAVAGQLQVELHAPTQSGLRVGRTATGGRVVRVATWSRSVAPFHFHRGEAVLELPLTQAQLAARSRPGAFGVVHVRLAVAGQGVFEATRDGVRLQKFTPVRDLLERQGLSRRLPVESP